MIKAILFDFGGTLDTDGVHWSEKFWELYQELDVPVEKRDFERAYVSAESKMAKSAVRSDVSLLSTLSMQVGYQLEYLASCGNLGGAIGDEVLVQAIASSGYQEVRDNVAVARKVLSELSRIYKLGVVSNFTGNLLAVLDELGIGNLFSVAVDSGVEGVSKPDPQIFRIALDRIGVAAQECVVVGDSYERDIVPARALGCKTIHLFKRSWKEPSATEKADYRISSIVELPGILQIIS